MSHVLDGSEIGRRVVSADAALVVPEKHVHHPVQAVLNSPVARTAGPTRCASITSEVI
jgi:hypothetical protein